MSKKNLDNIPSGTCICSICGESKENTEYSWYLTRHTKDGYRLRVNTNCDSCTKTNGSELRKIKKTLQKNHPKPNYGEPCQLCGKLVYAKGSMPNTSECTWGPWQCDHDHTTNTFRGWICKPCNTGLGSLGDSIDTIISNLQRYKG